MNARVFVIHADGLIVRLDIATTLGQVCAGVFPTAVKDIDMAYAPIVAVAPVARCYLDKTFRCPVLWIGSAAIDLLTEQAIATARDFLDAIAPPSEPTTPAPAPGEQP